MPRPEASRAGIPWERYPWATADVRRKFNTLVQRPSEREIRKWCRRGPGSVFDPGCVLFYRDHLPLGSSLLVEGSVSLDLGRGGRPGRAVLIEAPALLGAWYALQHASYPATARATTRAVVCLVPRSEIPRLETLARHAGALVGS